MKKSTKAPGNIRTTLDLPAALWRAVRERARRDDMPARKVVKLALEAYTQPKKGGR